MNNAVDLFTAVIVLAGITVMVRPTSQGPGFVTAFFNGFSGLVGTASRFTN